MPCPLAKLHCVHSILSNPTKLNCSVAWQCVNQGQTAVTQMITTLKSDQIITKIIRSQKKKRSPHTHMIQHYFIKKPNSCLLLCCATNQGVRMPVQSGMVQSHLVESGLATCGRAGIAARAVGFALPWLSLALIGACSEIPVKSQLTCDTRTG